MKITGWILLALVAGATITWFGFLRPEPPPVSPEDRAGIRVMPIPSELKIREGLCYFGEGVVHEFTGVKTPRLERAVERFYVRLSDHSGIHCLLQGTDTGISVREEAGTRTRLVIACGNSGNEYPSPGDDESYSLKIRPGRILLSAPQETGILFGLETLLQLVMRGEEGWGFPELRIEDRPRYPWRGLMIDACRHWIPKEVILRNLDAMGTVKMNVLHWHLTEYQGFRVESRVFPRLHEMGSNGEYYTQEEIREVIEYAADRGIRVVPEFDLPGHSTSWFAGHPELASAPGPYAPDTVFMILDPVMDPTREDVYAFLDAFFGEMSTLFPDQYIHIGGDEVNPRHWQENPDIQAFMKERGIEDHHALQAYFNIRLQEILSHHGKKMMGWDEILHPGLTGKGIAVQTWRDHASLWETARSGNRAILSAGYYLDYKQPAAYHYSVDPAIIPGAVDIEIDPDHWKGWDCTMDLSDMVLEGEIYLFGEGNELRGIMKFTAGAAGFSGVVQEGNRLAFEHDSNFGKFRYDLVTRGDSISGTAKLSFLTLQIRGSRSGGSDMPGGKSLPEFTRIEPLTPEQETHILGGEACMWTEMADALTIESRIWPRAAAIAEKLWSPAVLTGDTEDMYRRLMAVDDLLETRGLQHRESARILIREMAEEPFREPLAMLVDLLQEDKFFNRMVLYDPVLTTNTPLGRVVDAAAPESYTAYRFGKDVDLWISSSDREAFSRITAMMEDWRGNHLHLSPAFQTSWRLREVKPHSRNLSLIATAGLEALSGPVPPGATDSLFAAAAEAHGGTILAVAPHVQKLVAASAGK